MDKLTPWFPPEIKPIREGVYEVQGHYDGSEWYAYFDGERFCYRSRVGVGFAYAERFTFTLSSTHATWRGLARRPKNG